MATLTATTAAVAGTTFTPASAAGGGDKFLNYGNERLYIKNGGGGSITLTITPGGTPGGLTITPVTVTVAAGAEKIVGPFNPQYFNDSSGYVNLTYSGVSSVTVAVIN